MDFKPFINNISCSKYRRHGIKWHIVNYMQANRFSVKKTLFDHFLTRLRRLAHSYLLKQDQPLSISCIISRQIA